MLLSLSIVTYQVEPKQSTDMNIKEILRSF